jgi:hypothetical protein
MLRCIFVGSQNRFTELIAHWLSENTQLVGVVWTSSSEWAKSFSGILAFARRRLLRHGFAKAVNEATYYWLARKILRDHGEPCQSRLVNTYTAIHGAPVWKADCLLTCAINSAPVLNFVRERRPDLILSMCISEFFKWEIRELPRLGSFLWHEGIVPEYKGLYSPFWAIHNGEPEMLGYTVLKMNGRYDEGDVYAQGLVKGIDPKTDSPLYIGHKAILDSLPHVGVLLQQLEHGTAKPISTEGRVANSYTYPGLTDWIRMKLRAQQRTQEALMPAGRDSSIPAREWKR